MTKYCHLDTVSSDLVADSKTVVKAGHQIGTAGCSGNAGNLKPTEHHLHLEANTINSFNLNTGKRKINPTKIFKNEIIGY